MLEDSRMLRALLAMMIAAMLIHCQPSKTGTRIVLITLDTLRFDGLVPRDGHPSPMPRLWERAQAGSIFTRFYATTSVTQPTHATLFTSHPPWDHGVTRNGQSLTDDHVTLPELLRGAGYETHAVVASFPLSRRFGFGQGFDHYVEDFTLGEMATWIGRDVPKKEFFALADDVTDRALSQIDSASGDLQFYFFHYFDPHAPYGISAGERFSPARLFAALESGESTPSQLLDRARRMYALDLAYLDASLDRLLARLDEDAGDFETHVFVTSDHGESFGEAGTIGHGDRLTAAEIHVPAVILSPKVPPGHRDDVAGSIDVAPTLLALAGLGPLSEGMAGRDLSATSASRREIWGMRRSTKRAALGERRLDGQIHRLPKHWFYVIDHEGRIHRGNADRIVHGDEDDGGCKERDLAARFAALQARIQDSANVDDLDPRTKAALKALGYSR